MIATQKNIISSDNAEKFGPAFEWKGVEDKLSVLRNRFGITSDKENYFSSINHVRNCITHRKGRIGPEDLRGNEIFQLTWWGFDIFAETASGKRHSLMPPLPKEVLLLKEGGQIMLQVKDRIIEYKLRDIVTLSPNELIEICYLVQLTTGDIVKASYDYAKGVGIEENSIAKSDEQKNPDDVD
jgi:hypothetical protein